MRKIYVVTLTSEERTTLCELISLGKAAARKLSHARILLKGETRTPVLACPGQPARYDYEYKRNGVANLLKLLRGGQK